MYGLLVDLRHDILVLQKKTQEYELTKVDLQDKLYKLVDLEYLSEKAEEFGLVKERNPDYIKIGEKPAPKQQTAISL